MSRKDYSSKRPSFENDIRELEEIVKSLEREDLPLEMLLDKFERGVELLKRSRKFLQDARLRVEQYIEEKDGQWVLKDFDTGESTFPQLDLIHQDANDEDEDDDDGDDDRGGT